MLNRCLNAQSNTTRIETCCPGAVRPSGRWVWMPNPIQQGLKQQDRAITLREAAMSECPIQYNKDWNVIAAGYKWWISVGLNAQSNTTRIETLGVSACHHDWIIVWMPNPIQQGLKPLPGYLHPFHLQHVWMPNPIQQGLKLLRVGDIAAHR